MIGTIEGSRVFKHNQLYTNNIDDYNKSKKNINNTWFSWTATLFLNGDVSGGTFMQNSCSYFLTWFWTVNLVTGRIIIKKHCLRAPAHVFAIVCSCLAQSAVGLLHSQCRELYWQYEEQTKWVAKINAKMHISVKWILITATFQAQSRRRMVTKSALA